MDTEFNNKSNVDYLRILTYAIFIIMLLYFGKTLFIPLSFSVFISFIIYPISSSLEKRGIPRGLAITIGFILISLPFFGILLLLFRQIFSFSQKFPDIKKKLPDALNKLYSYLSDVFNIPVYELKEWIHNSFFESSDWLVQIINQTITISTLSLLFVLLIPVYVILILYYRATFIHFLVELFSQYSEAQIRLILNESIITYYNFVKGMIVVYLIVGLLNSIGLWFLGISDPFFFGFIASILTIVPYIGITVGAIVPISVAWIENESLWYPFGIILIFSFVQILEANVIFPLAVGKKLELNPLLVLLAVIGGGIIWGIAGMILFIPFLGIIKLVSEKIPAMKLMSLLLGRNRYD